MDNIDNLLGGTSENKNEDDQSDNNSELGPTEDQLYDALMGYYIK